MKDPSDAEAMPGEPVEDLEDGDGEEKLKKTAKIKERKYDDDEESLSACTKLKIVFMMALICVGIFGVIVLSWWIFAKVVEKNAIDHPAPAAAPSSTPDCSWIQEIWYQFGFGNC
jgi:hypothetical protein